MAYPNVKEATKVQENVAEYVSRLISCADWPKYHPWPPIGGLRHLIFHAESNGFKKVISRCGRRILINEQKFFEWVAERNQLQEAKRKVAGR